jgi:hypothetical protein
VIAANVAAIQFDFTDPQANDENGGTGYSEITVQGTPAATVTPPAILVSTANQNGASPFTPTWTTEIPDLIAGLSPTVVNGNFVNQTGMGGLPALTDGAIGVSGTVAGFASCGAGAGNTLIFSLTNSPNGSDVTNIVVYSGWGDTGRHGQYYTVSYSTVSAAATYIPLTTVFYLPENVSGAQANRVALSTPTGIALAKNVANVKFDFLTPPGAANFNNGWQGYSEIIVQGTNSGAPTVGLSPVIIQDTTPKYAETVVGDQVVFTAAYTNIPSVSLQWQFITSSLTNNINTGVVVVTNNGVVTSTLALNNVQTTDSGSYTLKAINLADGTAAPSYSTAAPLAVGSTPAAVNGIIVNYAGQTFFSSDTSYFPAWPVDTTNLNLILGFQVGDGSPGTSTYLGDFTGGGNYCNADPGTMTDGAAAAMTSLPNLAFCGCGRLDYGAGYQMTYTLVTTSATYGFDLTNITVFGGWNDATRNEQKYQVLYSTVQSPNTFTPLVTADYLPTDADGSPTVTRTTIVPANGVLVHNVAAVRFNWNLSPIPKNGFGGYSEILVGGTPSTGIVPSITSDVSPNTAADVAGSQLILTASFSGATTLQWQKDGTNVAGANTSTLILNNLQLTDTGAYALVASNSAGANQSSACSVTVNPLPTAVSNAVVAVAAQTSLGLSFTPTWDTSLLGSSLIYNVSPSSSGVGSFTIPDGNGENAAYPTILTDGSFGYLDVLGDNSTLTCIGSDAGAGNFVIYTLTGAANGYTITNIMSAGGWANDGRDQQAYTVYYSTVAAPTNFIPLAVVNYNPSNPSGISATRATITPAVGALATNVAELEFDMTSPGGENGYSGYNEIAVYGSPSAALLVAPPISTVTQAGGNLIVTGTGGYPPNSSYTWLSTTNLSSPVIWTTNSTGTLDGTGSFSNSIPIGTGPASFFRLQLP